MSGCLITESGLQGNSFSVGTVYEEEIVDVKPWNETAKRTYPNGDIYEGEVRDGKRHGQGTYKYSNGYVYEGEFVDGKPWNGTAKRTYPNGDIYEGEVRDGNRHGQGTYKYSNGAVYEGAFKDGKSWKGTLVYPKSQDGSQKVLQYKEGQVVSQELVYRASAV